MAEGAPSKELETKPEIHQAATVFVLTDEDTPRALLLKHKKLGVWLPPGGHVDSVESPYDAAIREVAEESGIDIAKYMPEPTRLDERAISLPLPNYILLEDIPARADQPAHIHQDSIYVVRVPFQETTRADLESDDLRWFNREELEELEMFPNARDLLGRILDGSNGVNKTEE